MRPDLVTITLTRADWEQAVGGLHRASEDALFKGGEKYSEDYDEAERADLIREAADLDRIARAIEQEVH
jgi:hypothetical protein